MHVSPVWRRARPAAEPDLALKQLRTRKHHQGVVPLFSPYRKCSQPIIDDSQRVDEVVSAQAGHEQAGVRAATVGAGKPMVGLDDEAVALGAPSNELKAQVRLKKPEGIVGCLALDNGGQPASQPMEFPGQETRCRTRPFAELVAE